MTRLSDPCILLIDQARDSAELVQALQLAGYGVESVGNVVKGIERVLAGEHALAILNTNRSGLEILRRIRRHSLLPIVVVSPNDDETERVSALESGADDYLQSPYKVPELLARIRAVLRRTGHGIALFSHIYRVHDIELDKLRRTATRNGETIVLTSVEFDLLAALLRSAGRVVTREELARASLGREWRVSDRSIDVHVSNLRKKLGRRENSERILTVRGVGYLYTLAPVAVNQT